MNVESCFSDMEKGCAYLGLKDPSLLITGRNRANHLFRPMQFSLINVFNHVVQGLFSEVLLLDSAEDTLRKIAGYHRHWLSVHRSQPLNAVRPLTASQAKRYGGFALHFLYTQ
jgi:hypothetical protein